MNSDHVAVIRQLYDAFARGDVPAVLDAAGAGVAIVSGILAAPDVTAAARAYAGRLGT